MLFLELIRWIINPNIAGMKDIFCFEIFNQIINLGEKPNIEGQEKFQVQKLYERVVNINEVYIYSNTSLIKASFFSRSNTLKCMT